MNNENRLHHVVVCSDCACGISNDDWSHIDSQVETEEESSEVMAGIEGTLELLGWLSHKERADFGGYWNCEVCGSVTIGTGEIFVTQEYFKETRA